jgi:hypothetical protein
VESIFSFFRSDDLVSALEKPGVKPGVLPPGSIRLGKILQLNAKNRTLDSIHPRIPTDHFMNVFFALTVIAECLDFGPELIIVGDHGAGFSVCAQVFSRVETKATEISDGTGLASFVLGAVCLRSVLDHKQAIFAGDVEDWIHVGHLSEQVHRHNSLGLGGDSPLNQLRVHVVGLLIDIYKHRGGAAKTDRFGCCDEGIRNSNYLIAGTNSERE